MKNQVSYQFESMSHHHIADKFPYSPFRRLSKNHLNFFTLSSANGCSCFRFIIIWKCSTCNCKFFCLHFTEVVPKIVRDRILLKFFVKLNFSLKWIIKKNLNCLMNEWNKWIKLEINLANASAFFSWKKWIYHCHPLPTLFELFFYQPFGKRQTSFDSNV